MNYDDYRLTEQYQVDRAAIADLTAKLSGCDDANKELRAEYADVMYSKNMEIADLTAKLEAAEARIKELEGEPDTTRCPDCGGQADNGFDRCLPPNPYSCSKCQQKDDYDRLCDRLEAGEA